MQPISGTRWIALALYIFAACGHGAERTGGRAMRGALSETRAAVLASDGELTRIVAGNAVTTTLATLTDPEQQATLQALITEVAGTATRGIIVGLGHESEMLSAMTTQATQRAIEGATASIATSLESGELRSAVRSMTADVSRKAIDDTCAALAKGVPECANLDCASCIERRISTVASVALAGATAELAGAVRVSVLGGAFFLGAVLALAITALAQRRRTKALISP